MTECSNYAATMAITLADQAAANGTLQGHSMTGRFCGIVGLSWDMGSGRCARPMSRSRPLYAAKTA